MNAYVEPNGTANSVDLHTTVYRNNITYFQFYDVSTIDNTITISLCYINTASLEPTLDHQNFEISLPVGYSSYILNIDLYGDNDGFPCTLTNLVDSVSISFDYPYNPLDKSTIPDDVFEDYLEYLGFGDDVSNNDLVFTHRIENVSVLLLAEIVVPLSGDVVSLEGIQFFEALRELICWNNEITEIDLSSNLILERLWSDNNNISQLDVTNNINLLVLKCGENTLSNLDLTNNINLEYLECWVNNINNIDVTQNTNLKYLSIGSNQISNIDTANNNLLEYFYCGGNLISSLNLSNNSYLLDFGFSNNSLSSIDLSNNMLIESLRGNNNDLTEIDVSNLSNLKTIDLSNNHLITLDLSTNTQVESVFLPFNNLTSLNLKNGNNSGILNLYAMDNDNLFCVDVDNENEAPYPDWYLDPQVVFSEDCTLGIEDILTTQITLYPNPIKDLLTIDNISSYEITSIKLYDLLGKLVLVERNDFNQLDLSHLNSGLFFIKIETEFGVITKKIIKE